MLNNRLFLSKKGRLIAACFAAFFILAFPIFQIVRYEKVIANGMAVKIHCRAYDPYDAFRGRYVRYSLSEEVGDEVILPKNKPSNKSIYIHSGYVLIAKDEDGFVKYKEVVRKRPSSGDYLHCRINRHRQWDDDGERTDEYTTRITLTGLDRYFMNEKLAPAAEQAMQKALGDENKSCHLEIKVLDGLAVPVQLYIDNERIEDYIKQM